MATIAQGILGGFSGKVGTVVGAIWKGIATMRAYSPNVTNPNSLAQQEQRAKFSLIVSFLRPFTSVLRFLFRDSAQKMTAFNAALKYNIGVAIKGAYPAFEIDYTKVILSKGNLEGALNPVASSDVPATIKVNWADNTSEGNASADDNAVIIAYHPVLKKQVTTIVGTRVAGTANVVAPDAWSGSEVEVYFAFTNASNDELSDSVYLGSILIA